MIHKKGRGFPAFFVLPGGGGQSPVMVKLSNHLLQSVIARWRDVRG
jgi:hypothetical protein